MIINYNIYTMQFFNTIGGLTNYNSVKTKTYGPPTKPATPITIGGTPANTTSSTVTYSGTTYTYYLIDTSGNFTINNVPDGFRINVFAIGGGGGGGSSNYSAQKSPGGGGGGQITEGTYYFSANSSAILTIKIGSGGRSIAETSQIGTQTGGSTTITGAGVNVLSAGGESGAMYRLSNGVTPAIYPANNRSGGKGVLLGGLSGTSGYDDSSTNPGGGGGGASSAGANNSGNSGGNGGNAKLPTASYGFPQNKYYGAGGGAMTINGTAGTGGTDGGSTIIGGSGFKQNTGIGPTAPVAKTGSGGGGCINGNPLGAGSSGAVIISINNIYIVP